MQVFLAMGSNIGNRRAFLREAVGQFPGAVAISQLYETKPVGGPQQANFYNIVVKASTHLSPQDLLAFCQDIEQKADRKREVRWGPRTLDIDILLYGDEQLHEPGLTIPHPRMTERDFVMEPLLEVYPHFKFTKPPSYSQSILNVLGPL